MKFFSEIKEATSFYLQTFFWLGLVLLLVFGIAVMARPDPAEADRPRQICERMLAAARTSTDTVLVLGMDPRTTYRTCAEYLP